jgi:hypothetical protein
MEEARALLDEPGMVRLEKGAPKKGGEGGEGAKSLGSNGAVTGVESDQVAKATDRGRGSGGGGEGQRSGAVAGRGSQSRGGYRCMGRAQGLLAQDDGVQWAGVGSSRPQSRGTHAGSAAMVRDKRQGGGRQGNLE